MSQRVNESDAELARRYRWLIDNMTGFEQTSMTCCRLDTDYDSVRGVSLDQCVVMTMKIQEKRSS